MWSNGLEIEAVILTAGYIRSSLTLVTYANKYVSVNTCYIYKSRCEVHEFNRVLNAFHFQCVQKFVLVSEGFEVKLSTFALSKDSFLSFTEVDDAHSSDHNTFSLTVPYNCSTMDILLLLMVKHQLLDTRWPEHFRRRSLIFADIIVSEFHFDECANCLSFVLRRGGCVALPSAYSC